MVSAVGTGVMKGPASSFQPGLRSMPYFIWQYTEPGFTLTITLPTEKYKWVLTNYLGNLRKIQKGNLWKASIP